MHLEHIPKSQGGNAVALSIVPQDLTVTITDAIVNEHPGTDLKGLARHVVDVVSPVYDEQDENRSMALLKEAYATALGHALSLRCERVLFPLLAIENGYPKDKALKAALSAISEFLAENEMEAMLAVMGMEFPTNGSFHGFDASSDEGYEKPVQPMAPRRVSDLSKIVEYSSIAMSPSPQSYQRRASPLLPPVRLDETFSKKLMKLIDEKGKTDVEVYKRANLDRRLFSKLRNNNHQPAKKTVLALSIALELDIEKTQDLLGRAGYALSPSVLFDVVVKWYIERGIFDIIEINTELVLRGQPILGG
jgi:O-acetyl-ADP-ribose deacetylase (regulator of RNase III)